MAVQRYSWRSASFSDGTWEEYWYDALGRRILTRARRDVSSIYDASISGPLCMGGIQCRSFTERVWWDGDQSLVEERTAEGVSDVSNNGLVGNIHGLTLDEPLAVITDQTRIVNYNWRGLGKSSVFPNGQAGDNSLGNPATEIDWPAGTQAQTYFTPGPGSGGSGNPKRWMGTFVANGQGTTGMLYRRNRYFNPGSGQFTQADPIGIAGGMNAFGFGSGDPFNFADPFGLCKDHDKERPCLVVWSSADHPDSDVDPRLLKHIQAIADAADVDLSLSSGRRRDDPRSNHFRGLAVDIKSINNIDIGTEESANPKAKRLVELVQGAAMNQPGTREDFGPWARYKSTQPGIFFPMGSASLAAHHQNHIHISIQP